jgi:hypothetical protein
MSGLPEPRCVACSPRYCRRAWIYVAHDYTAGLTKIGKSVNVSARFIYYRKRMKHDVHPVAKFQPTCDFLIFHLEEAAIQLLPAEQRAWGDWYRVPPDVAVEAVTTVLEGAR